MVSEIELKNFQINLMLEFFMCLSFNLLNLFLNFYSLGVAPPFFFQFVISKFWQSFCCLHFSLNLHYFFHFFPNKNCRIRKFRKKKETWWLRGKGGQTQLFNAKILSNYVAFTFTKEMKVKYILTSYVCVCVCVCCDFVSKLCN